MVESGDFGDFGDFGEREERFEECNGHGLESDDLRNVVLTELVRGAVEDLSRPHLVVCRDPVSGVTSYAGPYENGLVALCVAERDFQHERAADPNGHFEFSVAPLFGPTR